MCESQVMRRVDWRIRRSRADARNGGSRHIARSIRRIRWTCQTRQDLGAGICRGSARKIAEIPPNETRTSGNERGRSRRAIA
jgi:hypothetical protein